MWQLPVTSGVNQHGGGHAYGRRRMELLKRYWPGLVGALVIVVIIGLMVGGVIEP